MLAMALLVASCLGPADLLEASRIASHIGSATVGTLTMRYSYRGQRLTGEVRKVVDLGSGSFVEALVAGPDREAHGFDGQLAWMKDTSGFYLPEQGGDEPALAHNEAYRNAGAWWRPDHGGAKLDAMDCNAMKVTPPGGGPFEAWFDPATHLLMRIREARSFANVVETSYLDYAQRGSEKVATQIDIKTNDDPGSIETLRLTRFAIAPARSLSSYAMPKGQPKDWRLPSGKAEVPFRLLNNHVIVEARVNGRGPFAFLVDTGGHDIITPSTAAALGVLEVGQTGAAGAGERSTTSGYVVVERLQVGDARLSHQTVTALESPAEVEGIQLGGMIGVEFFERFVIQIDYGTRMLTLMTRKRFSPVDRALAGTPIPFKFYAHMPQVLGHLDGRQGLFNIDTGSRVELTLTAPFVDQERLRLAYPHGISITDGWGVGGPSRSYVVRASEFDLGDIKILDPVVGLSGSHHGSFSDASYQGNVGSGLLKRFVATFAYDSQTLYLKPTAHLDQDIGAFDRVGMWLNRAEGGVSVMDLAPGGPAEAGGLKVGDLITDIEGVSVHADTLSDIRRFLKLVPIGTPVGMTVRRDGASRWLILLPRDLVPTHYVRVAQ